jgi:osmoprotectant transport system substrate-binding protein
VTARGAAGRLPGRAWLAGAAVLAVVAMACAGDGHAPATAPEPGVRVASFDFPESRLMAEVYAQALEDEGVPVVREFDLGPRELVLPALRQGLVDVVPEYLGSLLTVAAPRTSIEGKDAQEARRRLAAAVEPWGLGVLEPSRAQNQNGFAVTRATAERQGLRRVSDLAPVADRLVLGGPAECPTRRYCLVGLRDVYGLRFGSFVPLSGGDLVRRALDDEVVDVGVLFTTDGALAGDELVLLADDEGLQPVENLVPVVRQEVLAGEGGARVATALDEVSAVLTTANLRFLNWRVTVAGNEPAREARGWLVRQGLVARR